MKLTQIKGLCYPVELYFTLPGSILILKHIKDTEKRSITPEVKGMADYIWEGYKNTGSFDFLKNLIDIPFCIIETKNTYVARPYYKHPLPLREDGFESSNVLHGDIVWVSTEV